MAEFAYTQTPHRLDEWNVRIHWHPVGGATAPEYTTYVVNGESQAVDAAVFALDGNCHPWAPVRAVRAEIRRLGNAGEWRSVAVTRTYV